MFTCPCCSVPLDKLESGIGMLWSCPKCNGRAVTVALLRQQVERQFMNHLWQDVRNAPVANRHGMRQCPSCHKPMVEIAMRGLTDPVEIDACKICQFLWFDASETAQLPVTPVLSTRKETLTPEAMEAVAMAKVRLIQERADREDRQETAIDWWNLADLISTILLLKR